MVSVQQFGKIRTHFLIDSTTLQGYQVGVQYRKHYTIETGLITSCLSVFDLEELSMETLLFSTFKPQPNLHVCKYPIIFSDPLHSW